MQTPSPVTSWAEYAIAGIATVLAGAAGSFFTWLYQRRKVSPEIDAIHATSEKTRAEARKLDSETIAQANDTINELWSICENQRVQISKLTVDNDKKAMGIELIESEMKWMKAVMDAAGVKLSDYDYLRRKKDE